MREGHLRAKKHVIVPVSTIDHVCIGLLRGAFGAVVGAAAGTATGGVAAKKIGMGLTDALLEAFQERLKPGISTLIVTLEHESAQRFTDAMADVGGVVLQETLTDEMVQQLLEKSKEEAGGEQ